MRAMSLPSRGNVMNQENERVSRLEVLESILQHRLSGRIRDLRVRVEDGELILQGQSTTYYAKQLAQHLAMQEAGLPIRANLIEVK